jgi:hypothetical protein
MPVLFAIGCWRSLPPCSAAAANSQKEIAGGPTHSSARIRRARSAPPRARAERTKSTYGPAPVPSAVIGLAVRRPCSMPSRRRENPYNLANGRDHFPRHLLSLRVFHFEQTHLNSVR